MGGDHAAPAGDHGAAPAGGEAMGQTPAGHDAAAPAEGEGHEAAPAESTTGGH